jgi:hypothetical protein
MFDLYDIHLPIYISHNILQAVNRFTQLADDSEDVPALEGKFYSNFKLTPQDWTKMELMRDILQVLEQH